jgi:hypothetical protein
VPIVLKSGSLNLLETSGPVKACNGIALPSVLRRKTSKEEEIKRPTASIFLSCSVVQGDVSHTYRRLLEDWRPFVPAVCCILLLCIVDAVCCFYMLEPEVLRDVFEW